MKWQRLGLLFRPCGERPWLHSHASLPVPLALGGDLFRIFFASRDERNRSHVAYVDVALGAPPRVVGIADGPALAPGPLGCFDDHGVYPASLVRDGKRILLYYIGWNRGVPPPLFYATIGLAISDDGGETFKRHSPAPLLGRSEHDPCLVTSPCALRENGGWRMWYVSGFRWEETAEGLHSYYDVKVARSNDGLDWSRDGTVAIALRPGERNVARPCVLHDRDCYRMWYSYAGDDGYRIGYAESADGERWERLDDRAGIVPSGVGWEGRALAYPWVFDHAGSRYLLYNGAGYGREGFGLAVAE